MNTSRVRTTSIVVVVLLLLAFRYAPAIGALLYMKWEFRNASELWVVPTPLPDLSIDRSPGKRFSYLGYEFESPWTEVKLERKFESLALVHFSDGQIISISDGADELKAMKQASRNGGTDLKNVFGDQPMSSNYALRSKILYLTPRDLRLFSTPREMVANSVLLNLKGIWTTTAKSGLYSFQTDWVRGFQEGSPTLNNLVTIAAFDAQDREVMLYIGAEPRAANRPSQAAINRILYSLRPAASSPTK
jgi:hypothetical protein